jgi:hypothetical protein
LKQRNLAKNGGMLDEVIWIARTKKDEDLAWLDVLLSTEPAYSRFNVSFEGKNYSSSYDVVKDKNMYIKIDDDIVSSPSYGRHNEDGHCLRSKVFFEDSAIPTIAYTKMMHPEYFVVSANIVNQPSLSWMHWRLGAVKPYLPEIHNTKPSSVIPQDLSVSWKASDLPYWEGPEDFNASEFHSPYAKHRWLPIDPNSPTHNIDDTPILETSFSAFSNGLWHWQLAAQQHYSFFENLEKNELWRYKFNMLDYVGMRMGIQFIAIMGEDINKAKPMHEDDEYYFSEVMVEKTGRRRSNRQRCSLIC